MTITIETTRTNRLPLYALLTANTISLVGSQLTMIALPWFVLQTTGSAALTGLAGFAGFLPAFIAGVFGGTLIDQFGYKRVSIIADVVSGLAITLVPLLYATVGLPFVALLALIFCGNMLGIPGLTARRSLLPELAALGDIRLERVNTAFESVRYVASLLGPPISGLLVVLIGASNVLWLDAASFLISASVVGLLVPALSTSASPRAPGRYRDELLAGLRFIRNDRMLLLLALSLAAANLFSNAFVAVVMPVYAEQQYGSATVLGLLVSMEGVGALLGALGFGIFGHRWLRRTLWVVAFVCAALPLWVMSAASPLWLLLAAFVFTGIVVGPLDPILVTVRHERIPPELRGRVFSTFSAITMAVVPLGILLAGYGIEWFGLQSTLVTMAVCLQLIGFAMLFVPRLREMDASRHQEQGVRLQEQAGVSNESPST